MNAITLSHRFTEENASSVHDVGRCIRSWGMRGILSGGLFGFVFAAILVAIPLTTDVLTFGTIGTLIVGTIECAVIAGGFGALAAALYGKGTLGTHMTRVLPALPIGRMPAHADWQEGDIPLSAWPTRWSFPGSTALQSTLPAADDYGEIIAPSVQQAQMTMSAIDSWENGGCGP